MCGRYTVNIGRARFEAVYQVQAPLEFASRFNLAPTQPAPIIRRAESGLEASLVGWGLNRSGTQRGAPLINARAETVSQLPSFATSFRQRRCLVPATGWYEWRMVAGKKQPYYLTANDGEPLAFAGIWTPSDQGDRFSIITTSANSAIHHIHDRMPVIIGKERWKIWFSDAPVSELESMLESYDAKALEFYPVSLSVGNVRNDDPKLLERTANLDQD